jgi:hypothetical protein
MDQLIKGYEMNSQRVGFGCDYRFVFKGLEKEEVD